MNEDVVCLESRVCLLFASAWARTGEESMLLRGVVKGGLVMRVKFFSKINANSEKEGLIPQSKKLLD